MKIAIWTRYVGLPLLAIMLAGCTAQASDPRHRKGHKMTRTYEVDDDGQITEIEKPDPKAERTRPLISNPDGRTVLVPSQLIGTVLDWRSDDDSAEEMLVTVGVSRDPVVPPNPPVLVYHVPAIPGVVNLYTPIAIIDYGIGGMVETVVIDAFPEQKISLAASFIRVRVFNPGVMDNSFFASVCRSRGNPHIGARYSELITLPPGGGGGIYTFSVPPYARSVKIVRNIPLLTQRGALTVDWKNLFGAIKDSGAYAALVDIPELIIPGEVSQLTVTNGDAVNPQDVTLVWFLEL